MMKPFSFSIFVVAFCALAYVASPFYTAWSIRSAAKAGDGGYLAKKINWTAIKPGLKESLTQIALDPDGTTLASSDRSQPGLWQRVKAFSTRVFIHSFVDRYANPTGFETLVTYGRSIVEQQTSDNNLSIMERVGRVWGRVQKAKFTSLTRFELDLRDKDDARRVYCGVLRFANWQWKLTELRVEQMRPQQVAQLVSGLVPVK